MLESQMVQVSESAVDAAGKDPGNHSPKASMVCTADHSSQQSPLSCEGSVCDRTSDYEDYWRPLGDSPGWQFLLLDFTSVLIHITQYNTQMHSFLTHSFTYEFILQI